MTSFARINLLTVLETEVDFKPTADTPTKCAASEQLAQITDRPDLLRGFSNNPVKGVSKGCPGVPAGTLLGTPDLYLIPAPLFCRKPDFMATWAQHRHWSQPRELRLCSCENHCVDGNEELHAYRFAPDPTRGDDHLLIEDVNQLEASVT